MKNTAIDSLGFFLPPASLTQAVRNFAKGLEGWLVNSLDQIPKKMADVKVSMIAIHVLYCKCLICYQMLWLIYTVFI